jgi:ABC-type uncharacterized transport system fused permease/ATPase subunit
VVADWRRDLMSDEKLLGELIAFRRYTEKRLDNVDDEFKEINKKLDGFGNWKIKVTTVAAVIGAIVTFILKQ